MRVVSYARLSIANQEDTITAQHASVQRWADAGDHKVVARRQDVGRSGQLPPEEREALNSALGLLESGRADAIAVRSLDRLARALHIQELILTRVWAANGQMWDVSGGGREMLADDPDDPYRTFLRQVLGATAQLERGTTLKRMRDGRRARRTENGGCRYVGGNPIRYGWRVEKGVGVLRADGTKAPMWVHDRKQWEACRLATEMRAKGMLLWSIANELDRLGYRSAMGRRIVPQTVRIALHNYAHPPGTFKSMEQLAAEQLVRRRHRIAPIVEESELRARRRRG